MDLYVDVFPYENLSMIIGFIRTSEPELSDENSLICIEFILLWYYEVLSGEFD